MENLRQPFSKKIVCCPICECEFKLKKENKLQKYRFIGETIYYVVCPGCGKEITLKTITFIPVYPNGCKTEIKESNLITPILIFREEKKNLEQEKMVK
ncbi:hypothetical protein MYX07_06725 [Patescibacteria group bacterium AH-259-L07]|nr:hypothetical protein [Patescibacteria group bacterium AH-259-L07]